MSRPPILFIITALLLSLSACERADPAFVAVTSSRTTFTIPEIIENTEQYEGREIVLDTFLIQHIEGPWLAADKSQPVQTTLSVTGLADCRYFDDTGTEIYVVEEPKAHVLALGTFHVGDYTDKTFGLKFEDHPYFELKTIVQAEQDEDDQAAAALKAKP